MSGITVWPNEIPESAPLFTDYMTYIHEQSKKTNAKKVCCKCKPMCYLTYDQAKIHIHEDDILKPSQINSKELFIAASTRHNNYKGEGEGNRTFYKIQDAPLSIYQKKKAKLASTSRRAKSADIQKSQAEDPSDTESVLSRTEPETNDNATESKPSKYKSIQQFIKANTPTNSKSKKKVLVTKSSKEKEDVLNSKLDKILDTVEEQKEISKETNKKIEVLEIKQQELENSIYQRNFAKNVQSDKYMKSAAKGSKKRKGAPTVDEEIKDVIPPKKLLKQGRAGHVATSEKLNLRSRSIRRPN